MGLSKSSTTLFLDSLSRSKKHTRASLGLKAGILIWTIGSCLTIALRGQLAAPWLDIGPLVSLVSAQYLCESFADPLQFTRWLVVETTSLVIELALWLFAFALIWDLNTQVHRRIKLLSIFAARLG